MATFREAREALLFAYQDGSIDDTEFALLYDLNSSENLEFSYWKYGRFDLASMTDDECKAEFRFFKNDTYLLGEVLDIPDIMKCPNRVLISHFQKVIQPWICTVVIREFKIRRLRNTATDKYATTHDQNHVTVHFSRVVVRLR